MPARQLYRDVHRLAAVLRREFPTKPNTYIRLMQNRWHSHGTTTLVCTGYLIRLRKQDLSVMFDTLLHEWAHVLTWHEEPDHGKGWARKYGEIYRWWENYEPD